MGNANCQPLDATSILHVTPSKHKDSIMDISLITKYNMDITASITDHDYDMPGFLSLTEFAENVVTYMSGFVVRSVKRKIKCLECLQELEEQEHVADRSLNLLKTKNRGII